ncbi:MAG: Rpn family recombination-promoting nuclease/putative transposase, partial [Ruminococcus sp.]|nr:Rpn family recombination-promoting nuclease/putative transposase [Ruminococcus sp.]
MEIKAKPKLDLVFKKIFSDVDNTDLLIDFLSTVLGISATEIVDVTILDNELPPEIVNKKFSRLDLLIKTKQGYINIEIQVKNYGDFPERSLFYWARTFSKQLNKNNEYSVLEPTISINIVDFKLFSDRDKAHSTYKLLETENHSELSDKLRIDFLELPKAKNCKDNHLQEWLNFLSVTTEEGLQMLETNTTTSEHIRKAIAVVRKMSADEKFLLEIEKREDAIRDEASARAYEREQGKQEGLQQGLRQGLQQGLQQERNAMIARLKSKGFTDK